MCDKMNSYITNRNAEGRKINIVANRRVWYRGVILPRLINLLTISANNI